MYPICTRVHVRIAAVEQALAALVERVAPELIVASGDLTHRGRREQHERAARFLRSLGPPVLAVPGNHDMPYTFPARFTRTFAEFERQWETTEPTHSSPTLHVVGLNSARPYRHQSGGSATSSCAAARSGSRRRPRARTASSSSTTTWSARRGGRRASGRSSHRNHVLRAARRRGRRPDPRRAHPPGGGERAARVRGRERRRARGGRLDRARARPAAAEPARRGARAARLRGRRADARRAHVHLARRRLGPHRAPDVPARARPPRRRAG